MAVQQSDTEIIAGLKSEESWAFRHLYENFFSMVETYVKRNRGNLDDAKDIFQEAIIALIKMLARESFILQQNTKLSTLFYAIAKRLWLLKLRSQRMDIINSDISDMTYQFSEDEDLLLEKKVKEERHNIIIAKLKLMGEECRKLLDLYYFKKIKLKEIAKIMSYSEGFVRVKKNRCMNELKSMIK